jgi:poly-gamma-glutamate synthesis protein (capsule biosynthesis protein)
VNVLLGAGLGVSGMARTPAEIQPTQFVVDGVSISHLSYTYGYNGKFMPTGEEWRSALIDPDRIVADARAAEAMGAELVIVSMHWGVEGSPAITAEQRRIAELLTASGSIDLIVGHHAHVLQPIEQVNGVWVLYGLGNMISNMPTGGLPLPATQDGAVATIEFRRRPDGGFDVTTPVIHPTWVDRQGGWIVRPVLAMLADPATPPGLRGELEASLNRTIAVVGPFVEPH